MRSLLSILALYNYDNTIFENMSIPTGIEKETLVNNLLLELSEFEVLYPNPAVMKSAIEFWSKKELPVWIKLLATTTQEYNPIFNQFRTEEWTDKETRNLAGTNNETRDLTGSNNETRNLTGADTHVSTTDGTTTNSGTDTQKDYVSAFNETTPTLSKQQEQTLGTSNTVHGGVDSLTTKTDGGTVNHALTDSGTVNHSLSDTGTVEQEHDAKFEGHTGIVPVQKLLEMERETVKFNTIDYIINSFKTRFCIMVY